MGIVGGITSWQETLACVDWSPLGFLAALRNLFFLRKALDATDSAYYILIFGVACAIVAGIFLILDSVIAHVFKQVLLRYPRATKQTGIIIKLATLAAWPIGSAITGMVGVWLDILKPSMEACIAVAISWGFILVAFFGERSGDGIRDLDSGEAE